LTVEGDTAGFSYAEAYISLNGLTYGPPSQFKPQCKDTGTSGMFASCSLVSPEGPFAFDILMNVPVSSADPSFPIRVGIYAGAVNEGLSDILGSGQLSILLPSGFTFTSASGVLLTGPPSAVPEPAMILLLGVGAAMTIRRRRGRGADRANGTPMV
jgi:hypothetical protein